MADETEKVRADDASSAHGPVRNRRSPGRPPWKPPAEKMVSRQVYMTEDEWQVCKEQGNASAFLRRLVNEFADRQREDRSRPGGGEDGETPTAEGG